MSHDHSESIAIEHSPSPAFQQRPHRAQSWRIAALVDAYRSQGYRVARLDPLALTPPPVVAALSAPFHGLDPMEDRGNDIAVLPSAITVHELERQLEGVYCGAIGLDCSGVRDESRRAWLFDRLESELSSEPPLPQLRSKRLRRLLDAEMWERHVAARFGDAKRFSLEGCESLVPLLDALVERAASRGVGQVFLGMPHRGRLNVLVNVMRFDASEILARLDHDSEVAARQRDLAYHLGGSARVKTEHGDVSLLLAHNPSHLQSVYPVVTGMARAYQDEHPDTLSLPVIVHGDAAFAGQGIVMETLNLARKDGYAVGGTVHVIVNNQIGFTTPNRMDAHSNAYCTDIARMVDAPVIHVNADEPDEVARAVAIALDYRMEHGADIVVDLIGYRRLGHSEHDIPAITQPFLQAAIATHPTVTELYHAQLGDERPLAELRADALRELENRTSKRVSPVSALDAQLPGAAPSAASARVGKPVTLARLRSLTAAVIELSRGFPVHDFVGRLVDGWQAAFADGERIERGEHGVEGVQRVDWCFAETMAYASLLDEGVSIRLSGMDVGRGTFMHRHAVWHSQAQTQDARDVHVPLRHLAAHQGKFDIVDSPLTEEAVLGFEYGYSVQSTTRLPIWEAQFGDFVNGAQVIIDQYIAAGEYKWGYRSRLTVLLPHGHEGVGPEHSSGYLGRFLQLCADGNLCIAMPTTSAQWFHLLRRQALSPDPKPLVVMTPKTQLYGNRLSHAPLAELAEGAFMPVLRDATFGVPEARDAVSRVVLVSGKFYYELLAAREASHDSSSAIVRIEQLYPFPSNELAQTLAEFSSLREVVWAQEEDANQGAWRFVRDELEAVLPAGCRLRNVCRTATPAGAHSSMQAHRQEQRRLIEAALA